ncbi:hypothetical protein [Mycolicibacterium pulveris]|uniref:hypothetical protein n=1 Tax=Mycolicibacterium pulveris TaxID=36813 RepID=UPI003CF296D9
MTSTGICWALREPTGARPAVVDHDHVDVTGDDGDIAGYQGAVRGALAIADASGHVVKSVALRYTDDVAANAWLLREWLHDMGFDDIDTAPVTRPAVRRRRRLAPLRAATVVVAGVIALFAVAPELSGQPDAASAESAPAATTSMESVTVVPLDAPTSALKIHRVADVPPPSQPAPVYTGDRSAPAAEATVEAAPDPNPVASEQDPMADVLSSLVSALP